MLSSPDDAKQKSTHKSLLKLSTPTKALHVRWRGNCHFSTLSQHTASHCRNNGCCAGAHLEAWQERLCADGLPDFGQAWVFRTRASTSPERTAHLSLALIAALFVQSRHGTSQGWAEPGQSLVAEWSCSPERCIF